MNPGQSMAMMGVDESESHFIYGVNPGQSMAIDCSDGVEIMAKSDDNKSNNKPIAISDKLLANCQVMK